MTNPPLPDPIAAAQRLLESVGPPAFPRDVDPEKTIKWVAGRISKGFYRAVAVHIH